MIPPDPEVREDQRDETRAFWNQTYARQLATQGAAPAVDMDEAHESVLERQFRSLVGELEGRDVLEIGCGLGDDTLRYARRGARVTSIDISEVAVEGVRQKLDSAGLPADVRVMDAFAVAELGMRFDLIVGRYILHHLEPFAALAEIFSRCLKPTGRIVFVENNARNPLLMFARNRIAGKFGVPKYGDNVEHPFTPQEVAMLRQHFADVECHFPQLVFVRKLNTYVFRHKPVFRPLTWALDHLDDSLWYLLPALRPWSYDQIVFAARPLPKS